MPQCPFCPHPPGGHLRVYFPKDAFEGVWADYVNGQNFSAPVDMVSLSKSLCLAHLVPHSSQSPAKPPEAAVCAGTSPSRQTSVTGMKYCIGKAVISVTACQNTHTVFCCPASHYLMACSCPTPDLLCKCKYMQRMSRHPVLCSVPRPGLAACVGLGREEAEGCYTRLQGIIRLGEVSNLISA